MERKVPFIVGETYHAYTRGVDKRVVYQNSSDYERFQLLLYVCNSTNAVDMRILRTRYKGFPSAEIFHGETSPHTLVDILAYALMPNHLHLLLKEKVQGGISRFMLKLMTAYSMYFNVKYERTGPLFTRPFRSRHINSDAYLLWCFAYILLNPLDLHQSDWKSGIANLVWAQRFLQTYPYASFADSVYKRPASRILTIDDRLPEKFVQIDTLLGELSKYEGEPFVL